VNEDIVIPIAGMLMIIILALGVPLVVSHVRRAASRDALRPGEPRGDGRLERIEQAIDAMSIEMERISEGQRFITKVLAERSGDQAAIPAATRRTD
jgi:hypothetical protein